MGISGQTNLARVNTTFFTGFQEIFLSGDANEWRLWTLVVPHDGTSFEVPVLTGYPRLREWVGAKQYPDLKAYRLNVPVKRWEASISLPRLDVMNDKSGLIDLVIQQFLSENDSPMQDLMTTSALGGLLGNPTGYDGVTLLNDAHPDAGGNADNNIASQIDFSVWRAAREAFLDTADIDGRLLGVRPTHLMVGPEKERTALDITGSGRPVPIGNTGTVDASSSVVAAVTLTNPIGDAAVIVNKAITDDSWFGMDLSKRIKPMIWAQNRALEAVVMDRMDTETRFEQDQLKYSLEADGVQVPGPWQLIVGASNP